MWEKQTLSNFVLLIVAHGEPTHTNNISRQHKQLAPNNFHNLQKVRIEAMLQGC
jgi:hypothetical protein